MSQEPRFGVRFLGRRMTAMPRATPLRSGGQDPVAANAATARSSPPRMVSATRGAKDVCAQARKIEGMRGGAMNDARFEERGMGVRPRLGDDAGMQANRPDPQSCH